MQVSVETTHGLERRITMAIPREKLTGEIQSRLQSLAQKAKIDGFRPGKVPFGVIKKKYQGAVKQEVMGELMQSVFYEAIRQENLHPAGMPHIEPVKEDDDQSELEFTATFEIYPEIVLSEMSTVKIERPVVDISDEALDKMIETIRKQKLDWNSVEREAAVGDRLTIDFVGKIDGEVFEGGQGKGMSVEIGAKRMIPGFEEKLVGMQVGEERDIELAFPEDYHAKDVAGKPVTFSIKLNTLEESSLPALDDEFVKGMGIEEGGVEAFRAQVKANMAREAQQATQSKVKQNVMAALLESHKIEVPKVLVDNEIDALMKQRQQTLGVDSLDLNAEMFEEEARRRVSLGLVLSEVVKQKDIKVEAAKIRNTIEGIAASYDHPGEVVKYYYSDKQRLAEIENYVLEQEVVDWVLAQSNVTDTSIEFDELMQKG